MTHALPDHYGDGQAAELMRDALKAFEPIARKALASCTSRDAEDILATLVDDVLPKIAVWISRCEDEGIASIDASADPLAENERMAANGITSIAAE